MSDIFISYKREEQALAAKLAKALERQGWTVWWDPKLRAGERFDDVIEDALQEAKCVIVMWSRRSVESEYVKDEALYALKRKKLAPVAIEDVELPFRFEVIHTPQLIDWDGSEESPAYQKLLEDIKAILHASPAVTKNKTGEKNSANEEDSTKAGEAKRQTQEEAQHHIAMGEQQKIEEKEKHQKNKRLIIGLSLALAMIVVIVAIIVATRPEPQRPVVNKTRALFADTGTYHLGDEAIKEWAKLHGSCYEAQFSVNFPIKALELQLETFGVENTSVKLNGRRVAFLPPQPIKQGSPRPNYWSSEHSVALSVSALNTGKNLLAICAEPVAAPAFPGDLDDFQFRNIKILAEQ